MLSRLRINLSNYLIMIILDLDLAISIFSSILLILVITSWFRYTIREGGKVSASKDVVQCPYCTYIFTDLFEKNIKICPRCESYIEKTGEKASL